MADKKEGVKGKKVFLDEKTIDAKNKKEAEEIYKHKKKLKNKEFNK